MKHPTCHGRPMWEVQNRNPNNGIPYNAPIYWCPDCHRAIQRKEPQEQPVEAHP